MSFRSPFVGGTPQFARIQFDPDPNADKGGKPPLDPNTLVKDEDKTINLDRPVKIDGKVLTPTQIAEKLKQAEAADATAAELKKAQEAVEVYKKRVQAAFNKDGEVTKEGRAAMVDFYQEAGLSKDDAEARVAEEWGEDDEGEPEKKPARKASKGKKEEENADELSRAQIRNLINDRQERACDEALRGSTEIATFFEALERREKNEDGELTDEAKKVVGEFKEDVKKAVIAETNRLVTQRLSKEGAQKFRQAWFDEAAAEACKAVAKKNRVYIGDPNKIGRTASQLDAEQNLRQLAEKKPVELKPYDPESGNVGTTFDENALKFIGDTFRRTAAVARAKKEGLKV